MDDFEKEEFAKEVVEVIEEGLDMEDVETKVPSDFPVNTIAFSNGKTAQMVFAKRGDDSIKILRTLSIRQPQALIMISGGASGLEAHHTARLNQLFSRAIARAAADVEAMIIDGGNKSGVMEMMGQGVADRGRKSFLLGVSPASQVSYPGCLEGDNCDLAPLEENHTHFVLVDTDEWGGETSTMFALAKNIAERKLATEFGDKKGTDFGIKGEIPVITILTNGGAISKQEVLYSVRRGWPIIILEGSGRAADEILNLWRDKPEKIDDPVLAEIVEEGTIHPYEIDDPIQGLERLVKRLLREDATLREAWERFAIYDLNAVLQRDKFEGMHLLVLRLGVIATALAITKTMSQTPEFANSIYKLIQTFTLYRVSFQAVQQAGDGFLMYFHKIFHVIILAVPITSAIVVTAFSKFSSGPKRIFLRACAESLKRDIYSYRARADKYTEKFTKEKSRESRLAARLKDLSTQLMQTDVNLSALRPYTEHIPPMYGAASGDDGFSYLTPERYVTVRLDDQLAYYRSKTLKLEKQMRRLQLWIWIVSGVGTFLAAIGLEVWIALTTAMGTAFTTYFEVQQVESNLVKFNQAATDLANVRGWWMALSPEEQARVRNIDVLVNRTEEILESEFKGWLQQMQEALDDDELDEVVSSEQKQGKAEEVPTES